MTTKQLELRSELIRKRIVLDRIAQPNERMAMSAVILLMVLGVMALAAVVRFFVGAL